MNKLLKIIVTSALTMVLIVIALLFVIPCMMIVFVGFIAYGLLTILISGIFLLENLIGNKGDL